jgi:hypothetical protein
MQSHKLPLETDTVAFLQAVTNLGLTGICKKCSNCGENCIERARAGNCVAYNKVKGELDAEHKKIASALTEPGEGGLEMNELEIIQTIGTCQEHAAAEIEAYRNKMQSDSQCYANSLKNYCMEQAYIFIGESIDGLTEDEQVDLFTDTGLDTLFKLNREGTFLSVMAGKLLNASDRINVASEETVREFILEELNND